MSVPPGRRGAALVAALFVLVVLDVVIGALCFVALQELRVGRNAAGARRAAGAAEAGLDAALSGWAGGGYGRLDVGAAASFAGTLAGGTGAWSGSVLRLNQRLFLIRSTGHDGGGRARRTQLLVVRLALPALATTAALTVSGTVRVGPEGRVVGASAAADEGPCGSAPDTVAGVLLPSADQLELASCALGGCVSGRPDLAVDPALATAAVPVVGESGWARLRGAADLELAAGAVLAGVSDADGHVFHAAGDLEIIGGLRRGVLLVEGNLVLSGGAEFRGLVLVRGALKFGDGGGRIVGSALAATAEIGISGGFGTDLIAHSGCSVSQALASAALAVPLPERAWAEAY